MDRKHRIGIIDIFLTAVSAFYLIGIRTLFSACGQKEDGTWMSCHWAGQAVTAIAAVLLVISVMRIIISDVKIRTGLSAAMIPTAVSGIFVPGTLVSLCMMDTMRCHTVMRPFVMIMSAAVSVICVIDILVNRKRL